ncbi:MAG: TlpA family protein disulfide reductase [Gammaproteobacteria bacterium]|nr:TlpA family protein disulfide reductase [Gammaproteobacteria bacterium]
MIKSLSLFTLLFCFTLNMQAANLKPFTANTATPPLKLTDLQGKTHDLKDYRGQVVLLQFWATYCGPCRKEMPSMNNMIKKMGDTPFTILAVDMGETEAEVKQFVKEVKPEFSILMDESGKSISDWQVFAAPSNFIIDPTGKIRYTLFGGVEWDSDEIINKLKELAPI